MILIKTAERTNMMNLYQKIRKKHQDEINSFPIYFAFGDEQFTEIIRDLNLSENKEDDNYYGKRLFKVGAGGFILKEDSPKLSEMLKSHDQQIKDLVEADKTGDGFIFDMFYYELCNHEYGYVYDEAIEDALRALGYTMEQVESDPRLKNGFDKACLAASSRECF